jgi:type IV secretion system protein VirB10
VSDETAATGPGPDLKVDPEELTLRARPRPVTRINRKVLMLVAGLGLLLVFGATIVALDPPSLRGGREREELYNVANKPTAEGLSELPASYGDLPPKPAPPKLGAPLPGDIGGPVVDMERDLGIAPPPSAAPALPFRPDPEEDALRAERIRQARLAQQGRESAVFFQVSNRPGQKTEDAKPSQTGILPPSSTDNRNPEGGTSADRRLRIDRENDQNLQGRKLDFLDQPVDAAVYNPHALQDPASPYQVMAGTVIAASLVTGINSDLPGTVIAQVTEAVYDTVTGRHLLIPQGSRLIGAYDSVVAFGQERALVAWRRIVMPDGASVVIENMPATDTAGYAGLADEVDFHTWRLIKGIVLSTLLGVGTELTFGTNESDLVRALRESTQDNVNQVGQRITERNLNIQPTIAVRPGWPLRVIVHKDLVLRPYRG